MTDIKNHEAITDVPAESQKSLLLDMAKKYGIEPLKFFTALKTTAFKQRDGSAPTNDQMISLLIIADKYGLNPFTKEIYAFPSGKGEIIPVVSVDGWSRIINDNPQFDGIEFVYSEVSIVPPGGKSCPEWIECVIHRKDRSQPTKVKEFLDETYQHARKFPGPWQTHTKRMLRHKALIQCARVAFSFSGISETDEAERILESFSARFENKLQPTIKDIPIKKPLALTSDLDSEALNLAKRVDIVGLKAIQRRVTQEHQAGDAEYINAKLESILNGGDSVIEHTTQAEHEMQQENYAEDYIPV